MWASEHLKGNIVRKIKKTYMDLGVILNYILQLNCYTTAQKSVLRMIDWGYGCQYNVKR